MRINLSPAGRTVCGSDRVRQGEQNMSFVLDREHLNPYWKFVSEQSKIKVAADVSRMCLRLQGHESLRNMCVKFVQHAAGGLLCEVLYPLTAFK